MKLANETGRSDFKLLALKFNSSHSLSSYCKENLIFDPIVRRVKVKQSVTAIRNNYNSHLSLSSHQFFNGQFLIHFCSIKGVSQKSIGYATAP